MFSCNSNLVRHENNQHSAVNVLCDICGISFSNQRKLSYHQRRMHNAEVHHPINVPCTSSSSTNIPDVPAKRRKINSEDEDHFCDVCKVSVNNIFSHIKSIVHKNSSLSKLCDEGADIEIISTAFKSRIVTYRISNLSQDFISLNDFMESIKIKMIKLIKMKVDIEISTKINFELFALYNKYNLKNEDDHAVDLVSSIKSFNTKNYIVTESSDLDLLHSELLGKLNAKSEDFTENESGWALDKILYMEININKYNPLRASSYRSLPYFVTKKRAVINVQNDDQACFAWSIMAAKYPNVPNPHLTSSYPNYNLELDLSNISLPMKVDSIPRFEILNENISVNVYGIDSQSEQIVGPLHLTKCKKSLHINLLFIEDGFNGHYCWIKNLSALVGSQISKRAHKLWICDGCLVFFRTELQLTEHTRNGCYKIKCTLPYGDKSFIKFKNIQNKESVPFVIYCDFEAILKPIDICLPNAQNSYTEKIIKHEPCSFAYYIKCAYDDQLSKLELYRGQDCMKVFIEKLKIDLEKMYDELNKNKEMILMTDAENLQYDNSTFCHICEQPFLADSFCKVKDHCHITGKFRGAAHQDCNLNYKVIKFVPLVCHNLSGYDAHFIIKELGFDNEPIDLLAQNKERYISFSKQFQVHPKKYITLRFIDSFKFLPSSIDSLSKNLDDNQFNEIRKFFPDSNAFNLIRKKGVFPYDFLDSHSKFDFPSLPSQESFYNKLNDCGVTAEQYNHAATVWDNFKCNDLGAYSDLYLKTDVLLLADIFENFRSVCLKTYSLDPAHYYTAPGLSWDSMLKFTKIKMELLTDIDMINFLDKGIRGGLSQCSKRYAKANNKYMKNYKTEESSKYLIYLDANNLYGYAMSESLPYKNFKWLTERDIANFKLDLTSADTSLGHILEVDLDYPSHLHKKHNDFPFCMENIKPDYISSKQNKLIANVKPKYKYVIHQECLKQCLSEGLVLKKIHRILQFNQTPFLKPYIDLNTHLRSHAKNSFEKDFFKLMNNAIFGKTLEDVFKRKDIRLLTHWSNIGKKLGANNLISKPNFHSSTRISNNLVAIQMNRLNVTLNKPIYVGFSVLELSKKVMYDFHYKYIIPKYEIHAPLSNADTNFYENKASLLYTDTDSLIYEIQTDDFYKDIENDIDARFDTSDFSPNNIFKLPLKNKKKLGMFKDECNGNILSEFVGLKAKTYCLLLEDDHIIKKAKGVKKSVVTNNISISDYRNCLFHSKKIIRSQQNFKSEKHIVFTQLINKLALSNNDDKRFVIPSSHKTLAWGSKELDNYYFV